MIGYPMQLPGGANPLFSQLAGAAGGGGMPPLPQGDLLALLRARMGLHGLPVLGPDSFGGPDYSGIPVDVSHGFKNGGGGIPVDVSHGFKNDSGGLTPVGPGFAPPPGPGGPPLSTMPVMPIGDGSPPQAGTPGMPVGTGSPPPPAASGLPLPIGHGNPLGDGSLLARAAGTKRGPRVIGPGGPFGGHPSY